MKNLRASLVLVSGMMLLISCVRKTETLDLTTLLTESEVGAHVMPEEIAAVEAPFGVINFERPVFKPDTLIIDADYNVTEEVNSAIRKLSETGGVVVVIPRGEWFCGRIELKSNVKLHISEGAVLSFSGEIEDYRPAVYTRIEGIEMMSLGDPGVAAAIIYIMNVSGWI